MLHLGLRKQKMLNNTALEYRTVDEVQKPANFSGIFIIFVFRSSVHIAVSNNFRVKKHLASYAQGAHTHTGKPSAVKAVTFADLN
jgi:hypothetical protein